MRSYDLGFDYPKVSLPALRTVSVRATAPFDGQEMHYRLAWRDTAEIAAFGQSRWAAPPSDLVRRHFLRATPSGTLAKCALEIELQDFTQVFRAREASEARIELRVALVAGNGRVATRGVTITEPDAGTNAAAGAPAFARATERAIGELAAWINAEPGCK
jgi:cholesterol transport system auxiliary component